MCHFDRPQSDTKRKDIVELQHVVVSDESSMLEFERGWDD